MHQFNNSAEGVVARPVPLFASSWVALFCVIRRRWAGYRDNAGQVGGSNRGESTPTKH